ncbi:MAG: NAD(P)-dependent malic enzyme [Myxococcota bacterium]
MKNNKNNNENRLEEANKPYEISEKLHRFYRGKIQMVPKAPVRSLNDFSYWYTPGVARPCRLIEADRQKVFDYTNKGNSIAVVSDGTRVLGLGNIGPEAALPVMEGKSLIFKYLGGVDAVPMCLEERDLQKLVALVKAMAPNFGGINLEDIESPKCYDLLDILREELNIPVWHDDRQGTATIILAGVINSFKLVGRDLTEAKFVLQGAGASNLAVAELLVLLDVPPGNIVLVDSKGILHDQRKIASNNRLKAKWARISNKWKLKGQLETALENADILIALSTPGPGIVAPELIQKMKKNSIVFACANPVPEIWPWEARDNGAAITATGRSDFANQLNNSLVFPGVFRGALDVQATTITDEMCVVAARAIAQRAQKIGLSSNFIVPTMEDEKVMTEVAVAVGRKAVESNLAGRELKVEELAASADRIISSARKNVKLMMENKIIPPVPEGNQFPSPKGS